MPGIGSTQHTWAEVSKGIKGLSNRFRKVSLSYLCDCQSALSVCMNL